MKMPSQEEVMRCADFWYMDQWENLACYMEDDDVKYLWKICNDPTTPRNYCIYDLNVQYWAEIIANQILQRGL